MIMQSSGTQQATGQCLWASPDTQHGPLATPLLALMLSCTMVLSWLQAEVLDPYPTAGPISQNYCKPSVGCQVLQRCCSHVFQLPLKRCSAASLALPIHGLQQHLHTTLHCSWCPTVIAQRTSGRSTPWQRHTWPRRHGMTSPCGAAAVIFAAQHPLPTALLQLESLLKLCSSPSCSMLQQISRAVPASQDPCV